MATAAAALAHHQWVHDAQFAEWLENSAARWDVHGVYVPERPFDLAEEVTRLRKVMEQHSSVNLFISEGAGAQEIVAAMEAAGKEVPRDLFGHVQLDKVDPGKWFARQFASRARRREGAGPEKRLFRTLGSRERGRPCADRDCTTYAVDAALRRRVQGGGS